jgi:ubiquinol-cytochrome c reductase cytochrome b subunit
MAWIVRAPLDEVANPADATYVPRPEWYFLSLFQLLKYFPGPAEPVATQVLPGLVVGFLALLPFLDRNPERRPWARSRLPYTATIAALGAGVVVLTGLGLRDTPGGKTPDDWGLLPLAGLELATGENSVCSRCHVAGGPAAPLERTRLTRDEEWLLNHMVDPVAIAPGVRAAEDRAPRSAMGRFGAQAVVAYLRRQHAGIEPPPIDPEVRLAALTYASTCVVCHRISGEGGTVGPDLTMVGLRRDAGGIRAVIEDASAVYGESSMPRFKDKLTGAQIEALASYLAGRK